jgi:all-trans-retinol 13,14-reductase
VQPSLAHLGIYVGFKETAEQLGLPKTNFWIYPSNDYDAALETFLQNKDAPFPVVYISFPSAKDPDYLNRHPGTATIEIVAPAPHEWFSKWQGSTWGKRGEEYEAFKAVAGYQHGELYGLAHTAERLQQDWLGPRTRIPGLWLTGQDVLTCGVTGAMMAGMLTTTAMVGMREMTPLMKKIAARRSRHEHKAVPAVKK